MGKPVAGCFCSSRGQWALSRVFWFLQMSKVWVQHLTFVECHNCCALNPSSYPAGLVYQNRPHRSVGIVQIIWPEKVFFRWDVPTGQKKTKTKKKNNLEKAWPPRAVFWNDIFECMRCCTEDLLVDNIPSFLHKVQHCQQHQPKRSSKGVLPRLSKSIAGSALFMGLAW